MNRVRFAAAMSRGSKAYSGLDGQFTIEELGKGDVGVSVIFAQTLKIAQIMQNALNDEQKARLLEIELSHVFRIEQRHRACRANG